MIAALPRATYRLQFHKDFTFAQGRELIPYLVKLGVSHVYSSPILTARPGSVHGYDVIDTEHVNPELGGEDGLRGLVSALRQHGLGLIVDIVPNHMAVGGMENAWWADVLRNGPASRYASFFDIDWEVDDPTLHGKVLAPFLGSQYGDALDAGELRLADGPGGETVVSYFDNFFPLRPEDQDLVRGPKANAFNPDSSLGRENLHQLLERQHYRLAWWGVAGDEINWRRFFDINGLAGLRTELPEVFETTHATLFRLFVEGLIDGFRLDHVDGLSDPGAYCHRLRARLKELAPQRPADAARGNPLIVAEKILGAGEALPEGWQIDGTTGYDFMNEVSAVQHDEAGRPALERLWHQETGRPAAFEPEEVTARHEVLEYGFAAQLGAPARSLHQVARSDPHTRDISLASIKRALTHLLAHFPVYRTYNAGQQRDSQDERAFQIALSGARAAAPAATHATLAHLDRWLGGSPTEDAALRRAQTQFQQLSAPIAAKAVEDTAFYRYGRLLSRNDVGFDAARLGCTATGFHEASQRRQATFPHAMLATATHDHKRGEDVRARLAVISEIPQEWVELVQHCRQAGAPAPDAAAEIMLYQMVVGTLPPAFDRADAAAYAPFADRLAQWQQKALREAKLRTSWASPDEAFEQEAEGFLRDLVQPDGQRFALLFDFMRRIAPAGAVNGLSQGILKMTAPGTPDFFQGTEFWDFSMVDPDNRRPVDYAVRQGALEHARTPVDLLPSWGNGRVKQSVIAATLSLRQALPDLFAQGRYRPLPVEGALSDHIVAFARHLEDRLALVVVPRLPAALNPDPVDLRLRAFQQSDTRVALPPEWHGRRWQSLLDGRRLEPSGSVPAAVLTAFPAAILTPQAA